MKNQSIGYLFKCLFLSLSLVIVGCNKDDKPKPKEYRGVDVLNEKPNQATLKIVNEAGEPLAQAQILIGYAEGAFQGNSGKSDEKGEFSVPSEWTNTEMVTVDAPGYIRATYMGLKPESKVFILKKKFVSQAQLRGVTTGHSVKNKDGYIDFSLVMAAMTRQDLLNFQMQKVLSPLNDTITILGKDVSIPANVSMPKQTESYSFFSITLDKPQYRLFFADKGVQRVFAARGRFPFKSVVDGLREKKQMYELINYFSITGGSVRDVNLEKDTTDLNIPVTDLTFKDKKEFIAPKLPNGQVMVAVAVADNGGYLIPTDFKRLSSEQKTNLAIWNDNPSILAQVIKNKNEFEEGKPGMDRISVVLSSFEERGATEYLPLISNPQTKGKNIFVVPEVSSNLNKVATYALISDIKTEKNSAGLLKKVSSAVWEVYASNWVSEIKLPEWTWDKTGAGTRFEVSLVGSTSNESIPLGPQMMEKVTHVTRSSVEY